MRGSDADTLHTAVDRAARRFAAKIKNCCRPDVRLKWDLIDRHSISEKMKWCIAMGSGMRAYLNDLFVHALHGDRVQETNLGRPGIALRILRPVIEDRLTQIVDALGEDHDSLRSHSRANSRTFFASTLSKSAFQIESGSDSLEKISKT